MQQLAAYQHHTNPAAAQKTQKSANAANRNLLRPLEGVRYERLSAPAYAQGAAAAAHLQAAYDSGNDLCTIRRQGPQPADQISQRQQVIDGERAPAVRDDHERTGGHDIGPPGRQREQHTILVVQVDPVLAPVLPVRDELEVPAEQRMEPVRHPHTSVPVIWMGCR
jgi:hypothetical protein